MTDLEARLARGEADAAIRKLEALYCDHWDSTRPDDWAALFTEDGVFARLEVFGVPGHAQRGREQLAEFCRTLQEGYGRFHMLTTIDLDIAPDALTATGRIGFQCKMTSTGDFPKVSLVTGYYDCAYRREGDTWLIETKIERQVFRSDEAYYGVYDAAMPLSNAGGSFADVR